MNYELIKPINPQYSTLEQILTNRGIQFNDIEHYLHVTEKDNLSPLFLNNIERAAKMLIQHISDDKSKIYVQVDSDCDGYTSSALLLNYIYTRFPSAIDKFYYNFHEGKTHGIDVESIQSGTTLVVVPDASSNEYNIHEKLSKQGIDVLVLDHHQAEKISEYACVVNNQLCDYPTKSLSGVGIVYKLCQYIDSILGDNIVDQFLDIVAIGLTGDMMDTRDLETHYLIQEGLKHLINPFIAGMANKNAYSLGDTLSPIGVAFYIVPLMNAITRVGTMQEKKLLFESMLNWKAYELIPSTKRGCAGQQETRLEQSLRTCTNVKNRQTRSQDAAVEQIRKIIKGNNLLDHKVLLVKIDSPTFDRGITGLIANKLMAEFQRPTILVTPTIYEDQLAWSGSARGYDKSTLKDFRGLVRESGLVYLAEGHPSAFGCALLDKNIEAFLQYTDTTLQDVEFSPNYKVDFIYSISTIRPNDILDIGEMKHLWGQCMDEPLLAIEHIAVTKDMITLMSRDKNPTLKIQLPNGVSCIKFKSSEKEFESLYTDSGCVVINAVAKAEVNRYFNNVTPQLIITDYEIIDKQEYYF